MKPLARTLDEVRRAQTAQYGEVDWPVSWWPAGPRSSYCVGWQTIQLGLRTGRESAAYLDAHPHLISIAAFRAHYQWPEVRPEQIRAGDLPLWNFSGRRVEVGGRLELEAEHMEWTYSAGRGSLVIVGANTGPVVGKLEPNGIWRKTRLNDAHLVAVIRPPYRPEKPSRARRHEVQIVAAWVNVHVPDGLPRTKASGPGPDAGHEGHNYWKLVQTWGRLHGYYPSNFTIDGIPGDQTRIVEAAAYKAAVAKR